jgi:hypothetical protein
MTKKEAKILILKRYLVNKVIIVNLLIPQDSDIPHNPKPVQGSLEHKARLDGKNVEPIGDGDGVS